MPSSGRQAASGSPYSAAFIAARICVRALRNQLRTVRSVTPSASAIWLSVAFENGPQDRGFSNPLRPAGDDLAQDAAELPDQDCTTDGVLSAGVEPGGLGDLLAMARSLSLVVGHRIGSENGKPVRQFTDALGRVGKVRVISTGGLDPVPIILRLAQLFQPNLQRRIRSWPDASAVIRDLDLLGPTPLTAAGLPRPFLAPDFAREGFIGGAEALPDGAASKGANDGAGDADLGHLVPTPELLGPALSQPRSLAPAVAHPAQPVGSEVVVDRQRPDLECGRVMSHTVARPPGRTVPHADIAARMATGRPAGVRAVERPDLCETAGSALPSLRVAWECLPRGRTGQQIAPGCPPLLPGALWLFLIPSLSLSTFKYWIVSAATIATPDEEPIFQCCTYYPVIQW